MPVALRSALAIVLETMALKLINWGERLHVWTWTWIAKETVPSQTLMAYLKTSRIT